MIKRITPIGRTIIIFASVVLYALAIPVQAALVGDYSFVVDNECVRITGYYGNGGYIRVPAMLEDGPVTTINDDAFVERTENVAGISLPEGLVSIGNTAFWGCQGLNSIHIPKSTTSIGNGAFSNCTNMKSITFHSGSTKIYDDPQTIPESANIIGPSPSTAKSYADKYDRSFTDINSVSGEASEITVAFDGAFVVFDQKPAVVGNSLLVPMGPIFKAMGATLGWNGNTMTATATKDDIKVVTQIGNQTAYINDTPQTLVVAPEAMGGRTMAPLRFVAEAFGYTAEWDSYSQTAFIY